MNIRNDWIKKEISKIYHQPIFELIYQAATVHRQHNDPHEIQVSTLLSIKTGGCPEDCAYCPQSVSYNTGVNVHKLLEVNYVLEKAKKAKHNGSSRFCMGAAWREVRDNADFDSIIAMVKEVNNMGMEVCCTLGMITEKQAKRLKEAGLYAYNHNLDTGEAHYQEIITTRKYKDRLNTLENVRKAEISVCSGGIVGLGETEIDRIGMLHTLATLPKHPESVPVNALVPVAGTPLENRPKVSIWDMVRMIATARIIMPKSQVRLSAGRVNMSIEDQALCFMAGANSIFSGDELLTTPNNSTEQDRLMFDTLGLKPMEAFKNKLETV